MADAREIINIDQMEVDRSNDMSQPLNPDSGWMAERQQLTSKVMKWSVYLAISFILVSVADYFLGAQQLAAAFEDVKRVIPDAQLPDLSLSTLIATNLPSFIFGLIISMAVPLCGYFGATEQSQTLVCLFCGCNFCSAIGNIIGIIMMTFFAAAVTSGAPEIERGMQKCDPELCQKFPNTDDQIRCLATPIHEWHPANPINPHIPADCPLFLVCQKPTFRKFLHNSSSFHVEHEDITNVNGDSYRGALLEAPDFYKHHNHHEAAENFAKWMKDFEKPQDPNSPLFEDDDFDPVKQCHINEKFVEGFHRARQLFPVLLPKLDEFLICKALFSAVITVLMCISGCWGYTLHKKLQAGYFIPGAVPYPHTMAAYPQGSQMQEFNRAPISQREQSN